MEPVKGGSLSFLPDDIAASLKAERPDNSISSWALRWVASKPNVKVVLSGMSTMEQVEDNLHTFDKFEPLTEKETNLIAKTADNIKKRTKNGCTGCAYCMPCPFGVDIPKNFHIWNELSMYGNKEKAKQAFFQDLSTAARADQCQKCGKCETVCPQGISIRENLAEAANDFNKLK